jgi:integrase
MYEEGFHIYTEEVGDAFILTHISRSSISKSHVSFTRTVVRRLNDVNAGICYQLIKPKPLPTVPSEYLEVLESYLRHCLTLKNKERTLSWKRKISSKFLRILADLGCSTIKDINTDYVCRAITHYENRDAYAVIRAFLRHLYDAKKVMFDYSGIIPKHRRGKILPTTYSIDEVVQLETSVDRTSKVGIRDYAVLLLVTRLGLRSGDIAGLTYDNVDFIGHTIRLTQEKTNQPLTLPLLPEIQEAIEEYIRFARPRSDSNFIFLSANAPHEKMTTSIMRHSLSNYFLASGINTFGKKHGL